MTARDYSHVRFISAGAGSGKTYRLTQELERALVEDGVAPGRVVGTTFTVKAAAELRGRVRERLIQSGRIALAEQTGQALIGTVHSVCERLLKRFAFELGLSPELSIASIEDCSGFFREALDAVLSAERLRDMRALAHAIGVEDWRDDVKRLADSGRANDLGPEAIAAMGQRCADELLSHFPAATPGPWDERLLEAVRDALERIDLTIDTTKGTAKYVKELKRAIYDLRRPPCPWPIWIRLAKAEATKRSDGLAAHVREAACVFPHHPRFQSDVRRYIEGTYSIAADALERFQLIKRERGLIDFTDMEQLMLHALDEPAVRARLETELELLLVDEFQDTNPMQLAIFMKLAELADKVVFVGDVKQAIYAFRGCDPELVFATLAALEGRGGASDVLEHSWRSRPALVEYVNGVFGQAFADVLDPAEIALAPKRSEQTGEPAVMAWLMEGNRRDQDEALARAIADFVASGYRVVDPETGETRPVRWGDVAVLCASNDNVELVARALRAAQVPIKMTLKGLLSVPEVCLATACLRRLNDRADTLATAEIVALADCTPPESWLADRLAWLERGEESRAWHEDTHPIVAKLKALREEIGTQSPVEIVARVLNSVGLREAVTAWGPNAIKAAQRQRNLDALLGLAVEYERHCDSQHLAATLTGFLFWLENPHSPELDLQPVVTTGDAVHVLTYHKAKGLEWPVVVTTDFYFSWGTRLWGVRVDGNGEPFELGRPLANRVIRYWPQIFGNHSRDVPVLDAIRASAPGRDCLARSDGENRRLAYVGLTRARDALVLALPARGSSQADAWIHAFAGDYLLPGGDSITLPNGARVPTRIAALGRGAEAAPPTPFAPRRLPARAPLEAPVRERVSPSEAPAVPDAEIAETEEIGARIPIFGSDMRIIGTALHAVIAAEIVNPDRADALARTAALLEGYGADAFVGADTALESARRFRAWIERRFRPTRVLTEYPITHRRSDGRVVSGWIDVLVETDAGLVVIDHKSSPRPRIDWLDELREHAGQLDAYREALEAAGKPVAGCWIHLPVGGAALRYARPGTASGSASSPLPC
ncbi:MAG TPA: UvrD-helicase domain-containing protein [Gammaproteobacteria bacterium]|nr:UvrD-helicase domain-containing protein [Gammaproteobacteria bacterium]